MRWSAKTKIVKTSHNLKKVMKRYGIEVAFLAPVKLAGLCSHIAKSKDKQKGCGKKHTDSYVGCCGSSFVWQGLHRTSCKMCDVPEHELSVQNQAGGHLPIHCSASHFIPSIHTIEILVHITLQKMTKDAPKFDTRM